MTDTMDDIRKRAETYTSGLHDKRITPEVYAAYIEGAKSMLPKAREGYKIVAKNGHLQSGRENFYDSKEEAQEFLTILQPQSSRQLEIILLREVLEDENE